jgi:hypothetical protein
MLIMAAGHEGKLLDYDALELWTGSVTRAGRGPARASGEPPLGFVR